MIETKRLYYFIKVWLGSFLSGILDSLFDAAEALRKGLIKTPIPIKRSRLQTTTNVF